MELPVPVTDPGRAGLAAILADPAATLLAVDYDGVLAPIVPDPANSPPLPGAVAALRRIGGVLGAVAVITGRPAQVVVDYCDLAPASAGSAHPPPASAGPADPPPSLAGLADLVVFGHYGLQRWDARTGGITAAAPPPGLAEVRRELPGLLEQAGVTDAWVEDKSAAVAVHTRRSADPAGALAAITEPLRRCAARHGLAVEPGRLVIEIRAPGVDKGGTLRSHTRSLSARAVCYIGDDLGDLPAFEAVEGMRHEGVAGLTVASGSTEVAAVAGRADLVVDGPPGVVTLLTALADALGASSQSMDRG